MILTLISPITAIVSVFIIAIVLAIFIFRRQLKVGNLISKAQNFDDIDKLRHELSPMRYTKDIDEKEKELILRYVARINEYSPKEIVRAYIRAHRKGFEEVREKLRKIIVINLKIRLDYIRQPQNAGIDFKQKLEQLQRMAQVINHKHYLEEIENLIEAKEPV